MELSVLKIFFLFTPLLTTNSLKYSHIQARKFFMFLKIVLKETQNAFNTEF